MKRFDIIYSILFPEPLPHQQVHKYLLLFNKIMYFFLINGAWIVPSLYFTSFHAFTLKVTFWFSRWLRIWHIISFSFILFVLWLYPQRTLIIPANWFEDVNGTVTLGNHVFASLKRCKFITCRIRYVYDMVDLMMMVTDCLCLIRSHVLWCIFEWILNLRGIKVCSISSTKTRLQSIYICIEIRLLSLCFLRTFFLSFLITQVSANIFEVVFFMVSFILLEIGCFDLLFIWFWRYFWVFFFLQLPLFIRKCFQFYFVCDWSFVEDKLS